MSTILITGFGPFPGAPYNPTIRLVERLTTLRRPALADVTIVGHVFETSYTAVDRDLPALIERYKPDALLMFGLAARTKYIRIETRARNALSLLPDATGAARSGLIAPGAPRQHAMPAPHRRLLVAARTAHVPAKLSRDAGNYLCNYVCWRASEAGGPKLAAFVHVPLGPHEATPYRAAHRTFTANKLSRAGTRILLALAAAVNRT
jgi:pyroglutamyl-peptidase